MYYLTGFPKIALSSFFINRQETKKLNLNMFCLLFSDKNDHFIASSSYKSNALCLSTAMYLSEWFPHFYHHI